MYYTIHSYIIQDFISTKSPVKFSNTRYVHDFPQSNWIKSSTNQTTNFTLPEDKISYSITLRWIFPIF